MSESRAGPLTPAKEVLTLELKTTKDNTTDLELLFGNSKDFDFVPNGIAAITGDFKGIGSHSSITNRKDIGEVSAQAPDPFHLPDKGTTITIGITIQSAENDFKLFGAFWSYKIGPLEGIPVKPTDFKVVVVGDPQNIFTITNDSDSYLSFTGLTFLNNVSELLSAATVGSIADFLPFQSFLLVAPHTTSQEFLFPELSPGNFLYVEGNEFVSDASGNPLDDAFSFRFGHQAAVVPEPSVLWLLVVGLLGISRSRRSGKYSASRLSRSRFIPELEKTAHDS